jgi:hypothetical protein
MTHGVFVVVSLNAGNGLLTKVSDDTVIIRSSFYQVAGTQDQIDR